MHVTVGRIWGQGLHYSRNLPSDFGIVGLPIFRFTAYSPLRGFSVCGIGMNLRVSRGAGRSVFCDPKTDWRGNHELRTMRVAPDFFCSVIAAERGGAFGMWGGCRRGVTERRCRGRSSHGSRGRGRGEDDGTDPVAADAGWRLHDLDRADDRHERELRARGPCVPAGRHRPRAFGSRSPREPARASWTPATPSSP